MLKTFSIGGIHPQENKLSANRPIELAKLPNRVSILLSQHIGAPARAIVKRGDVVKVGTKIGESVGFVSANIHSSVSGKVFKVDNVIDATGYPRLAVIIDVDGDEWEDTINRDNKLIKECNLSAQDIVKRITECGIVGLGGACFPTQIKLSPPPTFKAEYLIINGVECEPYLTSDHRLMLEKPEEILVGIQILMRAVGVTKAYIGIENNKKDAIQLFADLAESYVGVEVIPLKVKYPQGGEKQLIDAILKRRVNSGALPISTGAIVQNVGTVFAVYEAIQKNKPLFERIVTVTGSPVSNPSNFLVRIGTPISDLIHQAKGDIEKCGKIVSGGPMMGKALVSDDIPTSKRTSGVLLIAEDKAKRETVQSCIRCAKCVDVCPMGLEPYLLGALAENKEFEEMEAECIMDCIECGSCQYTCPTNRPLLDYCRLGKATVGKIIRARKTN